MSLLKLRRTNDSNVPSLYENKGEFQGALDIYVANTSIDNFLPLVNAYSSYSYSYLYKVSETLSPIEDAKEEMMFMNSIIAEACSELGISYFHPENSYSIIDKTVSYVVENGVQTDTSYIKTVIDDIQEAVRVMNEEVIVED